MPTNRTSLLVRRAAVLLLAGTTIFISLLYYRQIQTANRVNEALVEELENRSDTLRERVRAEQQHVQDRKTIAEQAARLRQYETKTNKGDVDSQSL